MGYVEQEINYTKIYFGLLKELIEIFDRDHHLPCGYECHTCDRLLELICQIEDTVQKGNDS